MNAMQSGMTSGSVILVRSLTDGEVVDVARVRGEIQDLRRGHLRRGHPRRA